MLTIASVVACALLVSAQGGPPSVTLDYATYQGQTVDGVNQFLGMRYAAPPLGDLRFRAPADPLKEDSVVNATSHGPICFGIDEPFNTTGQSDDCLFIDVYSPANATADSNLPVWFFIQGGGYVSNSNPNYSGNEVINMSDGNLIVVDFNYRAGAFGFLASERVRANGTLNVGLLDERAALNWVQKNIAQFGGDPSKVVIHGVSAGAGSVLHQMIAFGGRDDGLFIGGIASDPFFPREAQVSDLEFQFDLFASAAGCSNSTDQMACLRSQNSSTLQAANVAHPYQGRSNNPLFFYTPTIDGDFLQDYPYRLFQDGKFVQIPVIIGDDTDEGTAFAPNATSPEEVASFLKDNYPTLTQNNTDEINDLYPLMAPLPKHAAYFPSAAAAYGESTFTCVGNIVSGIVAEVKDVWNYRNNIQQAGNINAGLGVPHASEMPAIFGNKSTPGATIGVAPSGASNAPEIPIVMSYFVSFVRVLDPNVFKLADAPEWDSFKDGQVRLKFETNATAMEPIPDDQDDRCAFWESIGVQLQQ